MYAAIDHEGVVWGVGKTASEAIQDAAFWVGEAYGPHGDAFGLETHRSEDVQGVMVRGARVVVVSVLCSNPPSP